MGSAKKRPPRPSDASESDNFGLCTLCKLGEAGGRGVKLSQAVAPSGSLPFPESQVYPGPVVLPEGHSRPAFLDWSRQQKDAAAVRVLLGAFRRLKSGWLSCAALAELERRGEPRPHGCRALWEALAASSRMPSLIDVEYARCVLRRFEWDFNSWEAHPLRTQGEVLGLLARAVVVAGGEAPSLPTTPKPRRRGGWVVTDRRSAND